MFRRRRRRGRRRLAPAAAASAVATTKTTIPFSLRWMVPVLQACEITAAPQPIACGSEVEWTLNGMQFLEGVCCDELHEACDPPFPTSCTHVDCARAVRHVHAACDEWLASSSFHAEQRKMISELLTSCSNIAASSLTVSIAADGAAATTPPPRIPDMCGGRLIDGTENASASWRNQVAILAPKGLMVQLQVDSQWLPVDPENWKIQIYDGPGDPTQGQCRQSTAARPITTLTGTTLQHGRIQSSPGSNALCITWVDDQPLKGKPVMFGATIRCVCDASGPNNGGCGPHGKCSKDSGECECVDGFAGPNCSLTPCSGIDCGLHGTCTPINQGRNSTCQCAAEYYGELCDKTWHKQCGQPYNILSDTWRSVQHGSRAFGDLYATDKQKDDTKGKCDKSSAVTGVGGGQWYRFHSSIGDALPITKPGGGHCGTNNPGWLSGWKEAGAPPVYYDQPGTYPNKTIGIVAGTVCFDTSFGGSHCIASVGVNVVNCGDEFFLWQLPDAPTCGPTSCCSRAYCAARV